MPLVEVSVMSQKRAAIEAVRTHGRPIAVVAREVGVSRQTLYRWLAAVERDGEFGLVPRSRRPHTSPTRLDPRVSDALLALRDAHPAWGAAKLLTVLAREQPTLTDRWPAPSTVTRLLRAAGRIDPAVSAAHRRWQRFEADAPNALWQMDFVGPIPTAAGPVQLLTLLDDHSRYLVGLVVCFDQQTATVQAALTTAIAAVGRPTAILCDYGSPWGDAPDALHTRLTAWLLQGGVAVRHGRPAHPQTRGKVERLHRTLRLEALSGPLAADAAELQARLDAWRATYNQRRPHGALGYAVPASRYRAGAGVDLATLPPLALPAGLPTRKVSDPGKISYHGAIYVVGRAFIGDRVALEANPDGRAMVYWGPHAIGVLDLTQPGSRLERVSRMS
jgi:transposase InsO family protein